MISTNKIQPKKDTEDDKLRVITTNTVAPREFDFRPRNYGGFTKMETRKAGGDMMTTANLEKRQRNELRRRLSEKRRRLMAEKKLAPSVVVGEDKLGTVVEKPKKSSGKKKETLKKEE